MEENEVLMSTITSRRLMSMDGEEYLEMETEPQLNVTEVVGILQVAANEAMNGDGDG